MAQDSPQCDPFARGQFEELTEEEKLSAPAFEPFDAGAVHSGGSGVHTPDAAEKPAGKGGPAMSVGRIVALLLGVLCLLAIGVYLVSLRGGIGPE